MHGCRKKLFSPDTKTLADILRRTYSKINKLHNLSGEEKKYIYICFQHNVKIEELNFSLNKVVLN